MNIFENSKNALGFMFKSIGNTVSFVRKEINDSFNNIKQQETIQYAYQMMLRDELHTLSLAYQKEFDFNPNKPLSPKEWEPEIKRFLEFSKSHVFNSSLPNNIKHDIDTLVSQINLEDILRLHKRSLNRDINSVSFNHEDSPTHLVLSGGGAKGFAYAALIESLEEHKLNKHENALDRIKVVSGASAGALTALPLALGYSSSQINDIIKNQNFSLFFKESVALSSTGRQMYQNIKEFHQDHGRSGILMDIRSRIGHIFPLVSKFLLKNDKKEVSEFNAKLDKYDQLPQGLMSKLANEYFGKESKLSSIEKEVEFANLPQTTVYRFIEKHLSEDFLISHDINFDNESLDDSYIQKKRDEIKDFYTYRSLNKDYILNFMENIVYNGLKNKLGEDFTQVKDSLFADVLDPDEREDRMRTLSFSDLRKIIEMHPDKGLKELNIALTEIVSNPNKPFKSVHVNAESELSDMSIAEASRISMNLPIVFKNYEVNGRKFTDGGVADNSTKGAFDHLPSSKVLSAYFVTPSELKNNRTFFESFNEKYISDEKTGEIKIQKPSFSLKSIGEWIVGIPHKYLNTQHSRLRREDRNSIIPIFTGKIGTLDFGMDTESPEFKNIYNKVKETSKMMIMGKQHTANIKLTPDIETVFSNEKLQEFNFSVENLTEYTRKNAVHELATEHLHKNRETSDLSTKKGSHVTLDKMPLLEANKNCTFTNRMLQDRAYNGNDYSGYA